MKVSLFVTLKKWLPVIGFRHSFELTRCFAERKVDSGYLSGGSPESSKLTTANAQFSFGLHKFTKAVLTLEVIFYVNCQTALTLPTLIRYPERLR